MGRRPSIHRAEVGRVALLALLVALACVTAAILARGAAAAEGQAYTISGDGPGVLWPGQPAIPIDLSFSNPNDDSVTVSDLAVSIASIATPNATTAFPCPASDFVVTQFGGPATFSIPSGSSTLQSLGYAQSAWPTVQLVETNKNQNGCLGATVTLGYSAAGQDGPAVSPSNTGATTTTSAPLTPPATKHIALTIAPASQSIGVGGKASFKITARNTAGLKLTGVVVKDPKATACGRKLGALAKGASKSYTCSRAHVKAAFVDKATLRGTTSAGGTVTASATAKVKVAALTPPARLGLGIAMTPKSQTETTAIVIHKALGSSTKTVTRANARFTIHVTNSGNAILRSVKVSDARAPGCNHTIGALAAGASRHYSCTARSVKASFTNVAVATGKGSTGARVSARAEAKVKTKTKTGTVVTIAIPDVLFQFNKATLTPGAAHVLAAVAKVLKSHYARGQIRIVGFTDSIGTIDYNLMLSQARADTVATWLEQHGIPAHRIMVAWFGKADPVASNATPAGRRKNRRVTITVRNHS